MKVRVPTGNNRTTSQKADWLITNTVYTKVSMSKELGMSRPTFDKRMDGEEGKWKKLEVDRIRSIYKKLRTQEWKKESVKDGGTGKVERVKYVDVDDETGSDSSPDDSDVIYLIND